jgi:bis(5'-nucleosyl)-tetraphosphatase (symmetrical)
MAPMNYLVGDIQGCCNAFERLLAEIDFSPSRDHVYVLGDLVNRGPHSTDTLRRLCELGNAATSLLGNHDLHLLAVAHGGRKAHRGDTLTELLAAADRDTLLDWLRCQRMACQAHGWLMVHAGVVPQWDAQLTLALAGEVEQMLRSSSLRDFMQVMSGNEPLRWDPELTGAARLRFIINVLTRVRFVAADGTLELTTKGTPDNAPPGYYPWFEVPGRRTADTPIAFGHWSTLGLMNRENLLALDTGCAWGGLLTAARIDEGRRELIQVPCEPVPLPADAA